MRYNKNYVINNAINNIKVKNDINLRSAYENAVLYSMHKVPNCIDNHSLHRFLVNEIRHNYSNYDKSLNRINRSTRNRKVKEGYYIQYKNAVLNKIGTLYPSLKDECNNQKQEFEMVTLIK